MRKNHINTILLLFAIIADASGRYCWKDSICLFWITHELSISILLYTLVINLKNVPKIIVEGLFILSLFEIIDEFFKLGVIFSWYTEVVMALIGIWTIWRIVRLIRKGE